MTWRISFKARGDIFLNKVVGIVGKWKGGKGKARIAMFKLSYFEQFVPL